MAEIENLKIDGGATYTVGNQDIIANEWEVSKTYVKGKSYVTYEHGLYVCNTTHTSVSPIDLTKWTAITVGEAIAANTTDIGNLSTLTTTDKSSIVGAVNELDSDKADKSVTTSTVTAGTSITINRQRLWKIGKACFLNLNYATSASLNGSSKICDLPTGFEAISGATFDVFMHDNTNNVFYRGAVVANKVQFNTTATIPSGAGLCINAYWYTA